MSCSVISAARTSWEGGCPIDASASEAAIREHIADPLGQDVLEAAAGIVRVVNNSMAEALRIVSVERGHDAREFSLAAFGGAGPVHAAALAEELGIEEVIVPPIPGGFSALGLVATDLRRDYSHTFYTRIDEADMDALNRRLAELENAARTMLENAGLPEADRSIERSADCRYTRQAYELTAPLGDGPVTRATLDALADQFHARHLRTYGHKNPDEAVQMVNVRVTATGRLPGVEFHADVAATSGSAGEREREVLFGERVRCPVVARADLPAGAEGRPGPFIVEEMDCTIAVPPGWRARRDERGFILMTRSA